MFPSDFITRQISPCRARTEEACGLVSYNNSDTSLLRLHRSEYNYRRRETDLAAPLILLPLLGAQKQFAFYLLFPVDAGLEGDPSGPLTNSLCATLNKTRGRAVSRNAPSYFSPKRSTRQRATESFISLLLSTSFHLVILMPSAETLQDYTPSDYFLCSRF